MKCPFCQHAKTGIIDSRSDKGSTRRRRQCLACKRAFPTVEVLINAQQPSGQTAEEIRHLIKMSKVSLVVLKDYITKLEKLTS